MKPAFAPVPVQQLRPLKDSVLVSDMAFTERKLSSGIVLLNDNGTTAGIRPRWAQVYAVGPDQFDYEPGQWICVEHGRWTRGVEITDADGNTVTIRKIDPKDVLMVSDTQPDDSTLSEAVQASALARP